MTVAFSVFNNSGTILRTGNTMTVAQAKAQAGPGEYVITTGSDPVTQVVTNPTSDFPGISTKPPAASTIGQNKTTMLANGQDAVSFYGIPNGCIARIGLPPDQGIDPIPDATINDGTFIITTNVPGDYTVILSAFPAQDFVGKFHAS